MDIDGLLIASKIDPNRKEHPKTLEQGRIYVWDWSFLWRKAKDLYKEYFELVLQRGPQESLVIRTLSKKQLDSDM